MQQHTKKPQKSYDILKIGTKNVVVYWKFELLILNNICIQIELSY